MSTAGARQADGGQAAPDGAAIGQVGFGYWLARWLARRIGRLVFGWRVGGTEHVPASGGFIVAANHIAFADPPLIGAASPRPLRYMAKWELFEKPVFSHLIRALGAFPVRRSGFDREALGRSREHLAAGLGLLIFPWGTRIRTGSPPGRPGVSLLAAQAGVPVVPARIEGSARLRAALFRRPPVRIRFGPPIPPPPPGEGIEYREVLREHTARIMEAIDGLATG
jgi:1-acyl-sn-glycerol-3-phosphate acyltransferase